MEQESVAVGTANGARRGAVPAPMPFALPAGQLAELQGTLGFLHDLSSASLRRLYDYLEQNSPRHGELGGCLALAVEAARAFEAADYGRALAEVHHAYCEVSAARAANPDLPPLSGLARVTRAA